MEASASAPRNLRPKEKDKDNTLSAKEKANQSGEEKGTGVKTPRTTRYKDKFTSLREKYDQVVTQKNYRQDLETANIKMKKLQEEIDLLLEALMPNTPPAPSVSLDRPEREREMRYNNRVHTMDVDSEIQRDSLQLLSRDHYDSVHHDHPRSRHPQTNGMTNGSTTNGARRYSVEPEPELNPNHLPREGNGRISVS